MINQNYTCGICGSKYETIPERMECEKDCMQLQHAQSNLDKLENMDKLLTELRNLDDQIESLKKVQSEKLTEFYKHYGGTPFAITRLSDAQLVKNIFGV